MQPRKLSKRVRWIMGPVFNRVSGDIYLRVTMPNGNLTYAAVKANQRMVAWWCRHVVMFTNAVECEQMGPDSMW